MEPYYAMREVSHPTQFHSDIAHMPLGSLIEALIGEEAFFCWKFNVR